MHYNLVYLNLSGAIGSSIEFGELCLLWGFNTLISTLIILQYSNNTLIQYYYAEIFVI